MSCPHCNGQSTVDQTRTGKSGVRRIRRCLDCGERFSTLEAVTHALSKSPV